MLTPCQRWRDRRGTYRPAGEPVDTTTLGVEQLEQRDARAFVVRHHYSRSYPADRLRVGLLRSRPFRRAELVGVAVFSVPMSQRVIPKWTGQDPAAGVELGRLVLLDDVEANAESWFVARALRLVRRELPQVRAVVSFSDPLPRRGLDGTLVTPGHVGTVYQALNARHVGRTNRATIVLGPDGRVVPNRTMTKIRRGERGAGPAIERLVKLGAPPRRAHEDGRAWLHRALADGHRFRRVRHPGNLAYTWTVGDRRQRRRAARLARPARPYPKRQEMRCV